jgi:hypothetical protein
VFALLGYPNEEFVREILEDEINMAQNLTVTVAAFHEFQPWAKTQDWSALHV